MTCRVMAITIAAATLMVLGPTVVLAATHGGSGSRERLQDEIDRATGGLAREGIYIQETSLGAKDCVTVSVVNPTPANVAFLRKRFGDRLCLIPAHRPGGECAVRGNLDAGAATRTVPDLRDLGLYEAERRAIAAGFTYTIDCPGVGARRASRPSVASPEALVRVSHQCPAPGTRAPVSEPIGIEARVTLPGGFLYLVSPFEGVAPHVRCP